MKKHCARQSNRVVLFAIEMSKARLLTRKGLINHASKHRGRTACELMDWLNIEVREPTRGTTALASIYPQGGEKSRNPSSFRCVWGRGRFSGEFKGSHGFMSLATTAPTRSQLIEHILMMKKYDQDYARWALKQYHAAMPEMDLMSGVRDALKAAK